MKRQVTIDIAKHDDWEETYGRYYTCPHCKSKNVKNTDKYCSQCGYKITWEGVENANKV